jgi:large subunit ribosomal protein L18
MLNIKKILNQRLKRQKRVWAKIVGTSQRPRLTVFRSNQHLYLQVIDDSKNKTLAASSDFVKNKEITGTKTERAQLVAQELLKILKDKKIKSLVLDRSYYKYHGRIKEVAETLRKGGINL